MYFYFHLYRTSFYKFFFTLKYNIAICITTKIIDMIDITYEVIMSYKKIIIIIITVKKEINIKFFYIFKKPQNIYIYIHI